MENVIHCDLEELESVIKNLKKSARIVASGDAAEFSEKHKNDSFDEYRGRGFLYLPDFGDDEFSVNDIYIILFNKIKAPLSLLNKKTKVELDLRGVANLKSVPRRALTDCNNLKSILLPQGVTYIGWKAFENSESLKNVVLPESLKEIGFNAFTKCASLESVNIPSGVEKIGGGIFANCESLEKIEGGHFKIQGDLVLSADGKKLNSCLGKGDFVEIPKGVKIIEECSFERNMALQNIKFPTGLEEIGCEAFDCCYYLESVRIPNTVKKIGNGAFKACCGITKLTLSKGLEKIEDNAFWSCKSLERVSVPEGVKEIGIGAFSCCDSLRIVTLPDGLVKICESAFIESGLRRINIPESVKQIADDAFQNCDSLESIQIPAGAKIFKHKVLNMVEIDMLLSAINTGQEEYLENFDYKKFCLQTERLEIRPLLPSHYDQAVKYLADHKNTRLMTSLEDADENSIKEELKHSLYNWKNKMFGCCNFGVFLRGTKTNIGNITLGGLLMESGYSIGWVFHPAYHGKGYCTEAAKKVLDWVREWFAPDYVMATADVENLPSIAVMKKLGMTLEYRCSRQYKDGRKSGEVIYSMREIPDYYASNSSNVLSKKEIDQLLKACEKEDSKK